FDSTIIASCEEHDFIFTEMHLNGKTIDADDYFAILELANIKGKSYIDICSHYYNNIDICKIY
ncbi:MAG: hypothetical protein RR334_03435, partial [Clostridia bacterium]